MFATLKVFHLIMFHSYRSNEWRAKSLGLALPGNQHIPGTIFPDITRIFVILLVRYDFSLERVITFYFSFFTYENIDGTLKKIPETFFG